MTGRTVRLTDETIRRSLVELAGEPDASALLSEVLRTVDAVPQVRRRPWSSMRWERRVLLVAAVLATLGIGAAVSLSMPRPDPQPTPSPEGVVVPDFAVPFRYRLPQGVTEHLTSKGVVTPYPIFALTGDRLTLFRVTGGIHSCQDLDDESEGGLGSTSVGRDPVAFLEGLRDNVGVGIGPIQPAMLGNLPAVAAEIDPESGTCSRALVHENGLGLGATTQEPLLRGPSTLIVAQAGAETIGVLIRGADEAAYREWLPIAREYVRSFDFYAVDNLGT